VEIPIIKMGKLVLEFWYFGIWTFVLLGIWDL